MLYFCRLVILLSALFVPLRATSINLFQIAGFFHVDGSLVDQYDRLHVSYFESLDANNFGTFGFTFTNTGGLLANARFSMFLDADINSVYSDEFGSFIGLVLVPGAPALAIAADMWEIDEPQYTTGNIYTNLTAGLLDNSNSVTDPARDDVSLALSFFLGDIPDGGSYTITAFISATDINGLSHSDPDLVNPLTFYFNGYAQVSGTGGGGPPPDPGVPEPGTFALLALPLLYLARRRMRAPSLAVLGLMSIAPFTYAQSTATFTTTADFLRGNIVNLNLNTPGALQVNPPTGTQTFPFVNVAASARGTIVRIHATSGQVVGEYASSPDGYPRNPSRTTVDLEGNVWAGNRDANYLGKGSVVKVGLIVGGTRTDASGVDTPTGDYLKPPFLVNNCVDRNRDGLIRTSRGLGDILPWPNVTDAEGGTVALVEDAVDECILIYQATPGTNTRHVTVDTQNNVWVGGYPYSLLLFAKLDGRTGQILDQFDARTLGCGGYGGVVDKNGILWSSSPIEGKLLRYDPVTRVGVCTDIPFAYGIALATNGDLWTASYALNKMYRVAPDGSIRASYPVDVSPSGPTGTAVNPADGHVWVANRFSGTVSHLDADGRQLKVLTVGNTPTGVAVDANGKIWVSNYDSHNVMRIDPVGGADGLGAVDLTVDLTVFNSSYSYGAGPYNYSDMTGVIAIGSTSPQGAFNVIQDSGENGTVWSLADFNTEAGASVPVGSSIKVEVRASDSLASFPEYVEVQAGVRFQQVGRYLEARVTLRASPSGQSPIFTNLNLFGERRIEDLVSRAKDGAVDIQWTAVPQATAYNIYRKTEGGAFARLRQSFTPGGVPAIFPDSGLTNSTPYYYMVKWVDRAGNESPDSIIPSATATSRTARGLTSPTISSPPVVRGMQSMPYSYLVRATDPDTGDRLAYLLTTFPTGMTIDVNTGAIAWTPQLTQTGAQRVVVRVQDLGGRFASQSFDIFVSALRTNFNPVFTTTAPTSGVVGYPITYDANASDPNQGDVLTFSLEQGPTGATVRASDGLLRFTPGAAQTGNHSISIRVSDGQGGSALQSFVLLVGANRPPSFTSTAPTTGGTGVRYSYLATAVDPDGPPFTFEIVSAPTGFFIGPQSGIAEWVPQFSQTGAFPITLRVTDPAGAAATQTFTVTVSISNRPPAFTSVPGTTASATQPYTYDADATDPEGTAVKFGLNLYPYNMAINSSTGVISWTPTIAQTGVHNIMVRATDANGLNSFQTFLITVGAADITPPTVILTSPTNGSTYSSDITITGTVTDPNLRLWRVDYKPVGSSTWSVLTTGNSPVVNGSLGSLPATLLNNNAYRIRLYAEDTGSFNTTPEIEITINTNRLKLGAMTLAFDDVLLTNAPLPIALRRLYDSRQAESGDFGPGWKLGLSSLDLRLDVNNNAFITLPDGRRVAFAFAPQPSGFIGYLTKYNPAPGVADALEVVDCGLIFLSGGSYFCALQPDYNPQSWKLTTRAGIIYEFNRSGKLSRISDRSGRQMIFSASGITTNYGRSVTIVRDASNKIQRITDGNGNVHRYEYDASSRLITYYNPRNDISRFSYPATGQYLTSLQTPGNCNPLRVTYGPDGRVATKIDANNKVITFTYDLPNKVETQTDATFRVTTRRYDANGNLLEVIDPLNLRTQYQYDANGNNTLRIEPSGRRTERSFDARGNILTQILPGQSGNQTTTYSYSALDQIAEIRNPLGDRTVYGYDAQGHRTSRQKRDSSNNVVTSESWSYNAVGDQIGYLDQEGKATVYARNANGELSSYTDATGRTTAYSYDVNGNIISVTMPDGQSVQLGYDGFNRNVRATQNGLVYRNLVRDEEGNVLAETDALGRTTQHRYSCQGVVSGVTDAMGNSTAYSYDLYGNLLSFTDPANRNNSYLLDADERPTRRTDPAGAFTQFSFSPDGLEASRTNPLGQATFFANDGTMATTRITRPEGQMLFTYDGNTRLNRVDDNRNGGSKVTMIAYDSIGRIASLNHPGNRTVIYGYNGRNQKTSVTAPDGTVTTYLYDDGGRLTRVTTGASVVTFTLDASGRVGEALTSGGVRSTYTYDSRGRTLSMMVRDAANVTLASFIYTRNNMGAKKSRTATDGNSTYSYDALNRLSGDGVASFSYDAAGNRLDAGSSFSIDHRLTNDGTTAYSYDNAGRLLARGTSAYGYDSQGMLTTFTSPGGSATYGYDFLGRRVARSVGGAALEYVYDGDNAIAEYRGGAFNAHFSFAPGRDKPLMQRRSGATYFYHLDPNGNVALITDSAGAVAHRYAYSSFGTITSSIGSFAYTGAGLVNTYSFQGREFDEESGLYAFRARYYDAARGRFLSKDPLLGGLNAPQTMHPYAFAVNDPVNASDPTGKSVAVEYSSLITLPGFTEYAGALIGFLQGFAIPQLRFLGEYIGLDSGLDIGQRWDIAIANTSASIEATESYLSLYGNAKGTPPFVSGYASGATFKFGLEFTAATGGVSVKNDDFQLSISFGGFPEGASKALEYLGSLRPF